ERNPFTTRIRHFDFPRTRIPSHVKTYDGSGDPEDHIKLFQSAAKTERWAMPMWCHIQQTNHIKDPVEIHHIKQREGESTEDDSRTVKKKSPDVEGVAVKECMVTTSFLQGEVAAFSHGRKKAPCPGEATRRGENNELHKGFF
ncbi:hypothetical protein Tco_1470183, partial [Tanacetum coccineum]